MKKWLPIFLICLIISILLTPKVGIFAYTDNDYYNAVGAYYLGSLVASGNSSELDFSEGDGDENFLLALGEAIVTGDYTGLAEWGLNTLEETVTDIKEFVQTSVYNVNPDLYDFLYSDSYVKINLSDGHITKNLFTELQNNSESPTPTPNPDISYQYYIDMINGSGFWFKNWPNTDGFNQQGALFYYPPDSCSWYAFNHDFGNSVTTNHNYYVFSYEYLTINIYSDVNDSYSFNLNLPNPLNNFHSGNDYVSFGIISQYGNQKAFDGMSNNNPGNTLHYNSSTLTDMLIYISNSFKNVNIYVNGVPWSIVGEIESNPISLGNQVTIINNYPAQYTYGQPVYFDMNGLITRLVTAIQNKNVLTYQDIDDLIYDVNGNSVVGVLNFYRTDYDNLASEQIPFYPNFYYDNNLNQYVKAGADMINISTEVLPRDVLNILITAGVILLFGYVIRRLLE